MASPDPRTVAMRKPRLWRLLGPDGFCLDVAIDHGFFNEHSFLSSIEDMTSVIKTIVDAQPDAVQLSPGQAHLLQRIPGKKPALVLRTDVANVYGSPPAPHLFSELIEDAVLQAVRLDAAAVCVNLLKVENHPDSDRLHQQCVRNIMKLKVDCDAYGMPLMGQKYGVNGLLKDMLPLIRQAVELGADIIKADPTDDPKEYHQVIRIASPVPVLVRGGGKAPEKELFERTQELMKQGASGLVYGRNVIQHRNSRGITQALMSCVHNAATAEQALKILNP